MNNDLVQRLRDRAYGCKVPDPLVEEAADEIERLRLTDAEREAVANGIYLCEGEAGACNENVNSHAWAKAAGLLRGLLERTKEVANE